MRKPGIDGLRNRRVGIWGTGREGLGLARLASDLGAQLLIVSDPSQRSDDAACGGSSGQVEVGGDTYQVLSPRALLESDLDVVVHSPGVSIYRPEFEALRAKGVPVTSATEIWFEDFGGDRVIGVTGSKGKTTTSTFAAIALEASGVEAVLGGNIGRPVTDFYGTRPHEAYVIEVSSFQAADLAVSPRLGVLTLLSADHLDWHGSYEQYVRDKLNLFVHRDDVELAVNGRCSDAVSATASFGSRRHLYGNQGAVVLRGGSSVVVEGEEVGPFEGSVLRGRHNLENLCGAITVSRLFSGVWPDFAKLAAEIAKMPALQSRLETVAISDGIEFVDDALASNPAGSIAALAAFEGSPVSLIVGGHDRGADLGELIQILEARGDITVVHIDQAGMRLAVTLGATRSEVRTIHAAGLEEAVGLAAAALPRRGVVLFSPGAPTPASEGTYQDRSARFKDAVSEWLSVKPGGDDGLTKA